MFTFMFAYTEVGKRCGSLVLFEKARGRVVTRNIYRIE